MTLKAFPTFLCLLFLAVIVNAQSDYDQKTIDKARQIHESVITIDTHNDISVSNFTHEKNYTMELNTQVNLPKMDKGGLDVTWLIVYTGQGELTTEGYAKAAKNATDKFEAIHRLVKEFAPDQIELALTSDDVRRIHKKGKKIAMIGVENAYPMGLDINNVKKYHEMGARYMSLSHNGHSQFCDSNTGERDNVWLYNGLSDLGRKVIEEMNKYGIMIDLSHPSYESNKQTLLHSKAPVIASHSSARSLNDVSRNLEDDLLDMVKENGGVVQTVAFKSYVNSEKHKANRDAITKLYTETAAELGGEYKNRWQVRGMTEEDRKAYKEFEVKLHEATKNELAEINKKFPPVDVKDFVDHIDYMVNRIGIDHVGISSDFDGGGGVEGWEDASETFHVTLELVHRGYTKKEIAKLWGENLLRVLDDVQKVAKQLQKS